MQNYCMPKNDAPCNATACNTSKLNGRPKSNFVGGEWTLKT